MNKARTTLVIDKKYDKRRLVLLMEKIIKKKQQFVVLDLSKKQKIWRLVNSYVKNHSELITVVKYHKGYSNKKLKEIRKYFEQVNYVANSRGFPHVSEKCRVAIKKTDLVTITIHNYEYGKYLRECFESVFNQKNVNYEVIFSDNSSQDESWAIALEYQEKYPDRMTIIRNNRNYGPSINLKNCLISMTGKIHIQLCSDDYLLPGCLETCINVFSNNNSIAFAIFHRKIKDISGRIVSEEPFYENSGIIQGIEQAAVYMMAAVNPTISQVCYRNDMFSGINDDNPLSRWWASRINDFKLCLEFDVGYIAEPLVVNRLHENNDSVQTESKLLEIVGPYILNYYFLDASNQNEKILARENMSINKLCQLSLRYSARAILRKDYTLAKRYFYLSHALMLDLGVQDTVEYQVIERIIKKGSIQLNDIAMINKISNLPFRKKSYPLPQGSYILHL